MSEKPRLSAHQMALVVAYVDERLGGPLDIPALAAVLNMSIGHFYRSFKTSFGDRPGRYVKHRRIAHAMHLMIESDMPLAQVALACGMSDQPHFCHVFREHVGETPGRWRASRRDIA